MPTYDFACPVCEARFEVERPITAATELASCPVCASAGQRLFTMPRLLFKADPREVRPVWHNHESYSHQHAPGRGRHRKPDEDH